MEFEISRELYQTAITHSTVALMGKDAIHFDLN